MDRTPAFVSGLVILLVACILTYHYHATLKIEDLFTHLFYIPVILASIWWGKKGIFAAIFLGVLILTSHALFLTEMPISGDVVRAVMFVVIGGVVGWLMEGIKKVEELY